MTLTLPAAAAIGDTLAQIGTPSLLIDLDVFDKNLRAMADLTAAHGMALRPHGKAHKTSAIALRQIAAGAVGICCQKLSEAYPFALAGVKSIHISNEFVGADKVAMAVALAQAVTLSVCVDSLTQVADLAHAAEQAGVNIAVFPEVDIGANRCGVSHSDDLLHLVEAVTRSPALRFAGIQAYHGGVQHIRSWAARRDAAGFGADRTATFVSALAARGMRCPVVTGGGTGSVEFDVRSGVFTEIQAGSYLFLDGDYQDNEWREVVRPQTSLYALSTIMSAGRPGHAVCDVGLKGLAVDSGLPRFVAYLPGEDGPVLSYVAANDEHGILRVTGSDECGTAFLEGRRILLPPGHCDPTINLHDAFICYRGDRVEAIWPIDARGLSR